MCQASDHEVLPITTAMVEEEIAVKTAMGPAHLSLMMTIEKVDRGVLITLVSPLRGGIYMDLW